MHRLDASPAGLASADAARRLGQYGPNQIAPRRRLRVVRGLLTRFANPLVLILLGAAAVSAATGDVASFSIIAVVVALSVSLDFFQEYRAERAVEALQEQVALRVRVLRDGRELVAPARDLVPGDVVDLSAGDLLPADARLPRPGQSRDARTVQSKGRTPSPCEALPDGVSVRIDERTVYEPDALVRCGPHTPRDATEATDPIVVVEIVSPSSRGIDTGVKLAGYFALASVRHYLIVDLDKRVVIHHHRDQDGAIGVRILHGGPLTLDPPGLEIEIGDIFSSLCRAIGPNAASVPEVAHAGEEHRDAGRVGGGDHLLVAHRAAGLDHRRRAGLGDREQAVGEGEEGVGRRHGADRRRLGEAEGLGHVAGLAGGDAGRIRPGSSGRRRCRRWRRRGRRRWRWT